MNPWFLERSARCAFRLQRSNRVAQRGREGASGVSPSRRQKVLTIEGLAQRGQLHPVQKAWIDNEVPAVRLLPVGPDHDGGCAPREEPEPERQGHRRGDDQHLPLRHLHRIRGRDPRRGEIAEVGEGVRRQPMKNVSRREFLKQSAAIGGRP